MAASSTGLDVLRVLFKSRSAAEQDDLMAHLLLRLRSKDPEAFEMVVLHCNGLTHQQAAEHLKIVKSTASKRLSRGLKALRQWLETELAADREGLSMPESRKIGA